MIKRHLAGLVVAALVAGGGAAAWAAAPSGDSGTQTGQPAQASQPAQPGQQGQQQRGRKAGAGAIVRRTVHGDLVVRGKGGTFQNVTLDRGTVQAKGDNTLTLKRPDGPVVTVKVDANTRYRGVSSFDQVQTGQPAIVLSHDGTAIAVAQRSPGRNNGNGSNVGS